MLCKNWADLDQWAPHDPLLAPAKAVYHVTYIRSVVRVCLIHVLRQTVPCQLQAYAGGTATHTGHENSPGSQLLICPAWWTEQQLIPTLQLGHGSWSDAERRGIQRGPWQLTARPRELPFWRGFVWGPLGPESPCEPKLQSGDELLYCTQPQLLTVC